jgi:acid phosphatase family membrane protein YuiD
MLSGLLNSDIAINTNIVIMRAFVMIRQYALNYAELNQTIEKLIQETNVKFENNDVRTNEIFVLLKELLEHKKELEKPRNPIGFRTSANR